MGKSDIMKSNFRKIKKFKTDEIHIRDPFIFTSKKEGKYYLFGTTFADGCGDKDPVFEVFVGDDLKEWEGPYVAFEPPKGFWGVRHYWAPEVFEIDDQFYMFASFKGGIGENRGTGILISDSPGGPYVPHSHGAITPEGCECLDGTFYQDDLGNKWMVYCHEWTQLYEGKIKAIKLADDLKTSVGEPIEILNAAKMPWIRLFGDERIEKTGYLTDAPFMYKSKNGSLLMLWSSYTVPGYGEKGLGGYAVAIARSETGDITGEWTHDKELLLDRNAGHSSLFTDLAGQMYICTHYPDTPHGSERPLFIKIFENEDGIKVAE